MNPHQKTWERLVAAARRAPDDNEGSSPYGFSTRVAAAAFTCERPAMTPPALLWLRAAGVACLLAVGTVAANYSAISNSIGEPPSQPAQVAVAEGGDNEVSAVDIVDLSS